MIAQILFILAILASPFKSKSRLEAENAALRHQLTVLRRELYGRVQLTNNDRNRMAGVRDRVSGYGRLLASASEPSTR
jgi:hypothetical protein